MLRKLILGIPQDHQTATVGDAVVEPQALPKFLPASKLTEQQIEGVGETGDVWVPWRMSGGEQWYQRISGNDAARSSMVLGIAAEPEDDDEPEPDDNGDVLDHFRREVAILEARRDRGEITATDDDDDSIPPPYQHLEQLAESLVGRPIYVLLESGGGDFGSEHVGGYYGRRLDLIAKDFLVTAGRWRGRQPAIFIDDTGCNPTQIHATMLHELAHVIDSGFSGQPEEDIHPASMRLTRFNYAAGISTPIVPVEFDEQHSAGFVRAVLHLWHRLVDADYWVPIEWLFDGELYNAPDPFTANQALAGEAERLMQLPVSLIVTLPAPSAFDELFTR